MQTMAHATVLLAGSIYILNHARRVTPHTTHSDTGERVCESEKECLRAGDVLVHTRE